MNRQLPKGCLVAIFALVLIPTPFILICYGINKEWTESHRGLVYLSSIVVGAVVGAIYTSQKTK